MIITTIVYILMFTALILGLISTLILIKKTSKKHE